MICSLMIVLASCYNDKADKLYVSPTTTTCDTTTVTYSGSIQNIMTHNCAISGCHDGSNALARYNLTSYNGVVQSISHGLLDAINRNGSVVPMPQTGAKLSDCDITKITTWVNDGAAQ